MIISLKVSRLSKKILERDYPRPLQVTRRHILYPLLFSHKKKPLRSFLTETIEIDVSKPPANFYNAGENIHRYHLDKLETFIFGQFRFSSGATALKNYFAHYNITDDDYDMDSAYRRWQRFLQNKKALGDTEIGINNATSVVRKCRKFQRQELELFIARYSLNNLENFIGTRNQVKSIIFRHLRVWVYHYIGGYEIPDISKMLGLTIRKTYKSRNRFSYLIGRKKTFPFPEQLDTVL